jgi:hypothetical protein
VCIADSIEPAIVSLRGQSRRRVRVAIWPAYWHFAGIGEGDPISHANMSMRFLLCANCRRTFTLLHRLHTCSGASTLEGFAELTAAWELATTF